MADEELELRYAILNIVATPHPTGVYERLVNAAAKQKVYFWGDQIASITRPILAEEGFLEGRLVIWTEIDENEPAVMTDDLSEVAFEDLEINIPDNVGFNGKVFQWVFRLSDHKLFIEIKNEHGRTLSPQRAAKYFARLFSPETLGVDSPFVEVTLVPDDDTLEKLLAIPNLKKISIHLLRPNPDDVGAEAIKILQHLEEMGAKSQVTELTAHAGESLQLDEELTTQAKVAALNGFVEARGFEDGEAIHRSTKEYPKIIKRVASAFASGVSAAISAAKNTIVG